MNLFEKYRAATSLGIWFILIIVAVVIWKVDGNQRDDSHRESVEETAGLIARQFSGSLEETIGHLSNLRHRLEMTDFEYFQYWGEDASRIIELHKPFKFIEWIDSSAVIQRIEPKEGNEEAVGLDISTLDYRADDWIQTRRDSVFNITQWLELVQGDQAFLVDEPVYVNGEFYGTITAGIDFKPVFEQITAELEEYHIIVRDELQNPFFSSGTAEGIERFQHMAATDSIYISDANGSYWSVSVVPNSLFSETIWPFDNFIILLLTFILISLFSVLLFFMLKSSSEEKNALRNNRQFRALIESAPIAIYVIDSKGRVVDFWNSAAEKMLGWKREEVMGKFLPHVDEEHMDEYHEIMSEIFEKQSISSREVKRVRKDGTQRYFRLHVSNVPQEVDQMMVLLEDITKEKEYELELEKNLDEKNILLAEIHHRVKNNLAIILGLIELQSVEVSDELAQSLLVKTRNRIHSISGIHEMLYQNESFSDISFEEYVKKLVKRLQQSYENEDRPVQIQLDADNLRINMNRAVPLGLLLNELITNSYKHAFKKIENPVIEISFMRQNGNVRIEYRDNGPGFDLDKMEYTKSLGLTLIKTSLMQLEADYSISNSDGFSIVLNFSAELKSPMPS